MHHFAAVVVPVSTTRATAEQAVEKIMVPHEEGFNEETEESWGIWDWYQVGGRWTGVWGEYDPEQDPRNVETCKQCGGTGTRPGGLEQFGQAWFDDCNGCNGCLGKGRGPTWPTEWVAYDGDIITVRALLNNPPLQRPGTLFLPDGNVFQREWWTGESFAEDAEWSETLDKALLPYADQALVVVDFHS